MKRLTFLWFLLFFCSSVFAQTKPHWSDISNKPLFDIRDFGASEASSDCRIAIAAANASASAVVGAVLVPTGNYRVGASTITISADLISMGTITGEDTIIALGNNVRVSGGTYVGVKFQTYQKTGVSINNVSISSVTNWGVGFYETTNSFLLNSNIASISYGVLGSADGVFMGDSQNICVEKCHIQNFRRIGIVSDSVGSGLGYSDNIKIINNTVHNAHDCDDSATEWNAGIWAENTRAVNILYNNCYDITGNAGQTSGRVKGMTVSGGITATCTQIVLGNTIDGYLTIGNGVGLPLQSIVIEGNTFTNAAADSSAISLSGAAKRVDITRNSFDGFAATNIVASTILIGSNNATATQALMNISGNTFNTSHAGGAADVFVYYTYGPTVLNINDHAKVSFGSAFRTSEIGTMFTASKNANMTGPAAPYYMTGFRRMVFDKCRFPVGAVVDASASGTTRVSKCEFNAGVTAVNASNSSLFFSNCDFTYLLSTMAASSTLEVFDSTFTGFSAGGSSGGALLTNFQNTADTSVVVRNSTFLQPVGSTGIAIIKNGYNPTRVFTLGNYTNYPTFTDLVGTHTSNVSY